MKKSMSLLLISVLILLTLLPFATGDGIPFPPRKAITYDFSAIKERQQYAVVDVKSNYFEQINLYLALSSLDFEEHNTTVIIPLKSIPQDVDSNRITEKEFLSKYEFDKIQDKIRSESFGEFIKKVDPKTRILLEDYLLSSVFSPLHFLSRIKYPGYGPIYAENIFALGGTRTLPSGVTNIKRFEFEGGYMDIYGVESGQTLEDFLKEYQLEIPENVKLAIDRYRAYYIAVLNLEIKPIADIEFLKKYAPNTLKEAIDYVKANPELTFECIEYGYRRYYEETTIARIPPSYKKCDEIEIVKEKFKDFINKAKGEAGKKQLEVKNVWVKVPSIQASSSKAIYMYYGNPSATSTSTTATFEFFDDFSDLDYTTNPTWNNVNDWGRGNLDASSGALRLWQTCNCGNSANTTSSTDYGEWQLRFKLGSVGGCDFTRMIWYFIRNSSQYYYVQAGGDGPVTENRVILGNHLGRLAQTDAEVQGAWHTLRITRNTNGLFSIFLDNAQLFTATTNDNLTISNTMYISGHRNCGYADVYVDDVRIRKYTSSEPTIIIGEKTLNDDLLFSDWKYKVQISINENSGKTLNDYQIKIPFSKEWDIDSIRFYDPSTGRKLSYYIETIPTTAIENEIESAMIDFFLSAYSNKTKGTEISMTLPIKNNQVFYPLGTGMAWSTPIEDTKILVKMDKNLEVNFEHVQSSTIYKDNRYYFWEFRNWNPDYDITGIIKQSGFGTWISDSFKSIIRSMNKNSGAFAWFFALLAILISVIVTSILEKGRLLRDAISSVITTILAPVFSLWVLILLAFSLKTKPGINDLKILLRRNLILFGLILIFWCIFLIVEVVIK